MSTERLTVTIQVFGKDREDVIQKLTAAADDFFKEAPYRLRGGILTNAETETRTTHSGEVESLVIGYSATADYVSLVEGVNS